jgi:glycosyltransferase involved in cell wall biosynthesis
MQAEGKPGRPQMKHAAVVSEYMRRKGIDEGVLPPDTRVIYNGVEVYLFQRALRSDADGKLMVLQAGRVSADKGVHTTLEAIGRLVRECNFDRVHLYVVGSGPSDYQAHLQQIVAQWAIADKVSFLGRLPREDMPDLMARCQVLALPTESQEPFARVVLEAMASGLVVIGTLTGGTGEIIQHETTGLTFPAGDSWGLAQQIQRLATDSQLRRRLAAQGQQLVLEKFDLDRMVIHLEQLLEEARTDRMRH